MAIPCYIPSKDRASQCDLLLRSLSIHGNNLFNPHVVYTYSNEDYKKGYDQLISLWKNFSSSITFREEQNSEHEFYYFLEKHAANDELVALFADDCICYRKINVSENYLRYVFKKLPLWTFTFRLGDNITIRDYVDQRQTSKPKFLPYIDNDAFYWKWQSCDFWDMFGFACGFDGYLYRAKDLLEITNKEPFERICFFERLFCQKFQQNPPNDKPLMGCPLESNVVVQQINTVHNYGHRTNNTFHASTEELNRKWLDGYEISLQSMHFENDIPNCTHGERKFFYDLIEEPN